MGGIEFGPRRAAVLAITVLVHAGLLAFFVIGLGGGNREATPAAPVTTVVFALEPAAVPHDGRSVEPAFSAPPILSTAITVPPLSPPGEGSYVDWHAEARDAATPKAAPAPRSLSENPATAAHKEPAKPAPAHLAGEQYRGADGTWVVWVSDRCFVTSDPAPLGQPDILARAAASRTVCKGDPGWSRADLFKDLPAYQKYHPPETGAPPK